MQDLQESSPCKSIISFIGNSISSTNNRNVITLEAPGDSDVLCGKDKNLKNHPGNKAFSSMIDTMVTRYQGASTKQEKMNITREIVLVMKKQHNSRFLKKSIVDGKEVWSEIPDQLARDKVSHAIRFAAANPKRPSSERSQSPDAPMVTEKEQTNPDAPGNLSSPDTAMSALLQKHRMALTSTEISAMGDQVHEPHPAHFGISRYEDHLDSVRSEDIREFLIEPFGVRYDSRDLEFNSLRTEDLDVIMSEPIPVDEWGNQMLE